MRMSRTAGMAGWLFLSLVTPLRADNFVRDELRIPMAAAGPRGLEALLVRPDAQKRYPVALISHGSPRDGAERRTMTPNRYEAQAAEFVRRGFAALIVMRRGYGTSDGEFAEGNGSCASPNYLAAAQASVEDLRAAVAAMRERKDVTVQGMIAIGQSAGGFATVALTADPPPELAAAISFAGGRGSQAPGEVCAESKLIEAFGTFGKTSRVPMLWVYTQNDQYFAPRLSRQFADTFNANGGNAKLIDALAFGKDGHAFFASGIERWVPYVDGFLRDQKLGSNAVVAAAAKPDLQPPAQLSARNREQFASYLKASGHKAFAIAPNGAFGWRSGRRTIEEARTEALATCEENASGCAIYAADDVIEPKRR